MKPTFQPGDIIAVRGKGFLARGILAATGNTVSHVGMVVGDSPIIVIEALLRVLTRPIEESVADAETAYLLQDLSLSANKRDTVVKRACQFSADDYGWGDIVLQAANAIFRTTWFTDYLTFGLLKQFPICSYLVAESYQDDRPDFREAKGGVDYAGGHLQLRPEEPVDLHSHKVGYSGFHRTSLTSPGSGQWPAATNCSTARL